MIGAIMGIGGAAMGAINANSASKQSWENQVRLMDIQAQLNRQNAKFNTGQAKAIPAQILQGWEELTKKGKALIIQREQMEAYAQDVINMIS